jgi:hypothetical protein
VGFDKGFLLCLYQGDELEVLLFKLGFALLKTHVDWKGKNSCHQSKPWAGACPCSDVCLHLWLVM